MLNKKMRTFLLLTAASGLLTPAICVSCDNRDASQMFNDYKKALHDAQLLYNEYQKKYDSTAKNNDVDYLLKDFFLDDLLLYKNHEDSIKKNSLSRSATNLLSTRVINIFKIIDSLDNNTHQHSDFDNQYNQIKNNLETINKTIEEDIKNNKIRTTFKEVISELVSEYEQKLMMIKKTSSNELLNYIKDDIESLKKFYVDANVAKKVENAWANINDYNSISLLYSNELKNYKNLIDRKYDIANFFENTKYEELKDLHEGPSAQNADANVEFTHFKNIDFNYILLLWEQYLLINKNKFNDVLINDKELNKEKVNETKLNELVNRLNSQRYKDILDNAKDYRQLASFIYYVGPQDSENIKQLGLLDRLYFHTSNFSKTNNLFKNWENKIKNLKIISYKDNFKSEIPYLFRKSYEQSIWKNTFKSLSKSYTLPNDWDNFVIVL